jgi:hypothetical protein
MQISNKQLNILTNLLFNIFILKSSSPELIIPNQIEYVKVIRFTPKGKVNKNEPYQIKLKVYGCISKNCEIFIKRIKVIN